MSSTRRVFVDFLVERYAGNVELDDIKAAFEKHSDTISFFKQIPEQKWNYRYAEGKWSIKEMIQHIIDAERIFCFRALNFARQDKNELPGFDENEFAEVSNADRRSKEDLMEELATVQKSSTHLFASFDEEQLDQAGIANGKSIYVKGIGFIVVGHTLHHRNILVERYLKESE